MSRLFGESVPRKNQRQENVPSHIFTPRSYQVEILDSALKQNTIVCLGSDTGKSFISVMLIKELSHQVRPSLQAGGKRTIYLTSVVTSVETQAHIVSRQTDLCVGQYDSETLSQDWTRQRWEREIEDHHVLVMTPEVMQHVMVAEYVTLTQVNLLIFDQCHLAATDHPYAEIMHRYKECAPEQLPRVLGLTTAILNHQCTTPQELEGSLHTLENILQSTAETSTDMIVSDLYGSKPKEVVMESEEYNDKTSLVAQISNLLESALVFMSDCSPVWLRKSGDQDPRLLPRTVLVECQSILQNLGPWCAGRVAQALTKQMFKLEEAETDEKQKLLLQLTNTTLRMVHSTVDHEYENTVQSLEDFLLYMSPKVIHLIEILRNYKPDDNFMIIGDDDFTDMDFGSDASDDSLDLSDEDSDDDIANGGKNDRGSKAAVHYVAVKRTLAPEVLTNLEKQNDNILCGVVFVERRHTAFALNKLIQELCNWDPDLYFVQSSHITGQGGQKSGAGPRENEVTFRKQEEVLRKFRNKEVNLLISTSVLEEGVDVPRCNLVVRFDGPTDYRSYVQSKGRARAQNAKFFLLVEGPNMSKFQEDLDRYKGIENILVGRCQSQEDLLEEKVDLNYADTLLPAYKPEVEDEDASVSMATAMLLVNRYCAKLPSDAFTHLTPKCMTRTYESPETASYLSTLQLPINSPIKQPIQGEDMPSKRLAKMAVALKTCEILHKAGELDDHLQPVGKEVIKYEDEEGEWECQEAQGQARPGTTKRKQYYYKKPADALIGHPEVDNHCHLYNIKMVLTCPITEEQNTRGRKIHDPEETLRGFGLLIRKRIPLVPQFPVFTRSGEVTVSINLVRDDMIITQKDYARVKHFHHMVFTRVLRLEKDPMTFDLDNAHTSYIVVPLLKEAESDGLSIDWQFIDVVERATLTKKRCVLYEKPLEKFVFNKETFEDAVVMPSYRNIDQPQYFYVAEIRQDLTPRSPFPSPELYDTFEHYYTSKYNLEITSLQQPLLDVDHTSARLNLLTPRYMNQKGVALPTSSAETRRARRENLQQKQILVPELCDVHPFPASLWRKAVCLPAILYRMNCLLIAEEIRMMISKGAIIGKGKLDDEFRFPQLEFGFSTKPSSASLLELEAAPTAAPPSQTHDATMQKQSNNLTGQTLDRNAMTDDSIELVAEKDVSNQDPESTGSQETKLENVKKHNPEICPQQYDDINSEPSTTSVGEKPNGETLPYPPIIDTLEPTDCTETERESSRQHSLQPETTDEVYTHIIMNKGINITNHHIDTVCRKSCDMCECSTNRKQTQESCAVGAESVKAMNNRNTSSSCHCSGHQERHIEVESKAGKVPVSQPLYVDTGPSLLKDLEDESFHTPCQSLPGPSSATSVSSYHTDEASSSVNSSPVHTAHSDGLDMHNELISSADSHTRANAASALVRNEIPADCSRHTPPFCLTCSTSAHSEAADDCICSSPGQHPSNAANPYGKPSTLDAHDFVNGGSDCDNKESFCLHLETRVDRSGTNRTHGGSSPHGVAATHPTSSESTPGNHISHDNLIQGDCELNTGNTTASCGKTDPICPDSTPGEQTGKQMGTQTAEQTGAQQHEDHIDKLTDTTSKKEGESDEDDNCTPLISFDDKVHLESFVGPSPCVILQTLTMSNANDFFNLERLETIGDSFLKFAITVYLYCSYPGIHEGKLSYLRSKQVSNYNLYKLGKKKGFPDCMVAAKFEPTENWLPPGFVIKTNDAYKGINVLIASSKNKYVTEDLGKDEDKEVTNPVLTPEEKYKQELEEATRPEEPEKFDDPALSLKCLIPYNLQTQHSLPDKSIADCVEALIGCYLTTCGQRAALQFMSWLGLKVLPEMDDENGSDGKTPVKQSTNCNILLTSININRPVQVVAGFGKLQTPCSPLLTHVPHAESLLAHRLDGYEAFERRIKYTFNDRSYLLQAFTHASYHYNTITDCYQRLEFLGDAILDYVITRHLFEDVKKHSPGILTDLRSALVNNNIFAALAVKWDFHKFFKAISPQLFNVIEKFVSWQKAKHDEISLDEEFDETDDEKEGESEDIEIPKALGDIFESVAGAIYLDSGMSLDIVWRVYYRMMKPQIDAFTSKIPKSPVRELLELEPETAKFEKPERTLDGKIRVTVNVVGKGEFRGVGRNYRIAKSAAAKRALKFIRQLHTQMEAHAAHMMSLGLPQGMPSFTRHHILDQ